MQSLKMENKTKMLSAKASFAIEAMSINTE